MLARLGFTTIQKGLVLLWAIWHTLVTATNLFDALKQLGILPDGWTLASYNFELVHQTVAPHGVPVAVSAILFAGVIVWELLASALLWRAYAAMLRGEPGTGPEVTQAFCVGLALWGAMLIATEVTVNYLTAPTHKGTLGLMILSLLVVRSGAGAAVEAPAARPGA